MAGIVAFALSTAVLDRLFACVLVVFFVVDFFVVVGRFVELVLCDVVLCVEVVVCRFELVVVAFLASITRCGRSRSRWK